MASKYPEKNPNYSPSTSYNYSPQSGFNTNSPTNPHRRSDHFRKDAPGNTNERLIRQNDIIIKLLKEIRDRLPACSVVHDAVDIPAVGTADGAESVVHEETDSPALAADEVDEADAEEQNSGNC